MSFAQAKYVPLSDKNGPVFGGGIIDNNPPNQIPFANTPYGRNFRLLGYGVAPRPGFQQFSTDLGGTGTAPVGMGAYLRTDPANDRFVIAYQYSATQGLVTVDPDTEAQAQITTGALLTSTNHTNFVSTNDAMYVMNGEDPMGKLSGTTYTATGPTVSSSFQGGGLDDMTVTAVADASQVAHTFVIEYDQVAMFPDTFKWNVDGGSYTTGVSTNAGPQLLAYGVTVSFGASTGHTLGEGYIVTITPFAPAFGVWFNNSLWVGGVPLNPNRLYKSATNNADSFTLAGNDRFDCLNPLVGLGASAQTLYVFSETTIDMINNQSVKMTSSIPYYVSVPLETSEGASNHASIVSIGNACYFLSKSNKIKRIAQGSGQIYDVQELSHRQYEGITKIMATLDSDQTKSFAYAIPDKQLIKWHLKTIGATYNDICIVYNYEYDQFMADTQKVFAAGVSYKDKAFTVSQIEKKMYRDEYSHDDDGASIQFEYRTKVLDYGMPTVLKEIWQSRLFLELNTSTVLTQETYAEGSLIDTATIDQDDIPNIAIGIGTDEVGTYAIGEEGNPADYLYDTDIVREKGDLQVRAKNFQFTYKGHALGQNFLLKTLDAKIQMLDELTTSTHR